MRTEDMIRSGNLSQPIITGTEVNYYLLCKRKLWLFSRGIQMEHTSDNVFMGKLIDEHSYRRAKKEILIDGIVKIDFMDSDDQEMVNFYERVVRKAAEHHLTLGMQASLGAV